MLITFAQDMDTNYEPNEYQIVCVVGGTPVAINSQGWVDARTYGVTCNHVYPASPNSFDFSGEPNCFVTVAAGENYPAFGPVDCPIS